VSIATDPPTPVPDRRDRSVAAPRAVGTVFALNGFLFAGWAVRLPDVSERMHASHAALGAALLCISLGALATMRVTGTLCERLGSGLVTVVAAILLSLSAGLPGLVGSQAALCVALAVFGAAGGMLNVAMNSAGVILEEMSGTPLLPRLHAASSFGGLAGGVVGGLAAARVGAAPHLIAIGGAALMVTGSAARSLLLIDGRQGLVRRPSRPSGEQLPRAARRSVLILGAVAGCAAYGEGALGDWGALHLVEDLASSAPVAAGGYAAFCLAMGCGRLAGHRLLLHVGATRSSVAGCLLAAVGMLLGALATSVGPAMLGLVLAGLGFSNVFPVAVGRAGALAGARGVALATTIGYGGLLAGPAMIGGLASSAGLPLALTTVSMLAAVACCLVVQVRNEAPSRVRWLPSPTEAWVRLKWRIAPTAAGLHAAAHRHALSLTVLDPSRPELARSQPPLRRPGDFQDLNALLGTSVRHASGSLVSADGLMCARR
jgi:MFS family permease